MHRISINVWLYSNLLGSSNADYGNYFITFQDKHYDVGLCKWKTSAKMQISSEFGISIPWFNVESNASGKRAIVWDSISNVDLLSCVNSLGCPTMLPLRTWRPTQPGIIILSYLKKQIHIIWKTKNYMTCLRNIIWLLNCCSNICKSNGLITNILYFISVKMDTHMDKTTTSAR